MHPKTLLVLGVTTRGLSMSHIARRILHNIRHLVTTVLHDAKLRENENKISQLGCLVVDYTHPAL